MVDVIGRKYGNWTIIDNAVNEIDKHRMVKVKCLCGHETIKRLQQIRDCPTKKCMQCKSNKQDEIKC